MSQAIEALKILSPVLTATQFERFMMNIWDEDTFGLYHIWNDMCRVALIIGAVDTGNTLADDKDMVIWRMPNMELIGILRDGSGCRTLTK